MRSFDLIIIRGNVKEKVRKEEYCMDRNEKEIDSIFIHLTLTGACLLTVGHLHNCTLAPSPQKQASLFLKKKTPSGFSN